MYTYVGADGKEVVIKDYDNNTVAEIAFEAAGSYYINLYAVDATNDALVKSKSLWKCLSCFACVERCPRDVKPGKLIDAARQVVIRQKDADYLKPDEVPELLDEDLPQQLLVSAFRRYRR